MQIAIDRLLQGHIEKIGIEVPSDFIDIREEELSFPSFISIQGKAYLVEEEIFIKLQIQTKAQIPCSICNQPIEFAIDIPDLLHIVSLLDIKGSHYNYSDAVREEILLQIPAFTECEGTCPERAHIIPFLKKPAADVFPFSGLE